MTIRTFHAALLDEATSVAARLLPRDRDIAGVLRTAVEELRAAAPVATTATDATGAARHWARCAAAESALQMATCEARRRRRLSTEEFRKFQLVVAAARRGRTEALLSLRAGGTHT